MQGTILQVSVSRGGVPKTAVQEAWAGVNGLSGDSWAHPRIHGGPKQAVLIITVASLMELKHLGFDLRHGDLGENLTLDGIEAMRFEAGQRYLAGDAVLELTKPRRPCKTLSAHGAGIQAAVGERLRGGYYARVVREGNIRPGDIIALD